MTKDTIPTEALIIPIVINLHFSEWKDGVLPTKEDLAILKATSDTDTTAFRSSEYKEKIKTITFEKGINIPNGVPSWDISTSGNGNVMAYITPNQEDSTYYDLYIQSDAQLYANEDMSNWFKGMTYIDEINNIELLDTSMTKNMAGMFEDTGYNSNIFVLDLNNFDTSNVTNMYAIFYRMGRNNTLFTLDISHFDTSNVINARSMFNETGYNSSILSLDVSNLDTSKMTNMYKMFYKTGYNNPTFTLDVSNFDTSKVTNMNSMFSYIGYNSSKLKLDVSNFDTSKVTDMDSMFACTAYNNPNFKLDVSNFDTSNVTNMAYMFSQTGKASTVIQLDVSKFNTSKVIYMNGMFDSIGISNPNFTLDLSNFDTSNVTNMNAMFYYAANNSTKLNTTITIRNPNITDYEDIFIGTAVEDGAKITVNYTAETSALVDLMIANKSTKSNIVKGVQVS